MRVRDVPSSANEKPIKSAVVCTTHAGSACGSSVASGIEAGAKPRIENATEPVGNPVQRVVSSPPSHG